MLTLQRSLMYMSKYHDDSTISIMHDILVEKADYYAMLFCSGTRKATASRISELAARIYDKLTS